MKITCDSSEIEAALSSLREALEGGFYIPIESVEFADDLICVEPDIVSATADEIIVRPKPGNCLLRYLAAARALDWNVNVIAESHLSLTTTGAFAHG
jgi:hypothetical protein